jgi:hypothetical protein
MINGVWKMRCNKGCGWNETHTTKFHEEQQQLVATLKVPPHHPYWLLSGKPYSAAAVAAAAVSASKSGGATAAPAAASSASVVTSAPSSKLSAAQRKQQRLARRPCYIAPQALVAGFVADQLVAELEELDCFTGVLKTDCIAHYTAARQRLVERCSNVVAGTQRLQVEQKRSAAAAVLSAAV